LSHWLATANWAQTGQPVSGEVIVVNVKARFIHFLISGRQMFGSGRAVLALRESYREDLRQVKRITILNMSISRHLP